MAMVHAPFGNNAIMLWAEPGGPIMLKAVEASGDPVELNADQATDLAELLRSLAAQISD